MSFHQITIWLTSVNGLHDHYETGTNDAVPIGTYYQRVCVCVLKCHKHTNPTEQFKQIVNKAFFILPKPSTLVSKGPKVMVVTK